MSLRSIHWAGGAKVFRGDSVITFLRGWACCCSGRRAEKIREAGNYTMAMPSVVSCKACLKVIAEAEGKRRG